MCGRNCGSGNLGCCVLPREQTWGDDLRLEVKAVPQPPSCSPGARGASIQSGETLGPEHFPRSWLTA